MGIGFRREAIRALAPASELSVGIRMEGAGIWLGKRGKRSNSRRERGPLGVGRGRPQVDTGYG